jgi:hypothetical protein
MFRKILLAGAALALSASVAAAVSTPLTYTTGPTDVIPPDVNTIGFIEDTFNVVAGVYNETFSWGALSKGATGLPQGLSFTLYDSNSNAVATDIVYYGAVPSNSAKTSYAPLTLAGGTYFIDLSTDTKLSANGVNYTLTAAVPGPIAGAGLPAVVLLAGLLLYRRRTT